MVDTRLGSRERGHTAGVRQVDAAGRRWYTRLFKEQVIAECLAADASVSRVAVDHGLNPNLVRKWLARAGRPESEQVRMLPVVAVPELVADEPPAWRHAVEVQVGDAVILIGEQASGEIVRAIVRALR